MDLEFKGRFSRLQDMLFLVGLNNQLTMKYLGGGGGGKQGFQIDCVCLKNANITKRNSLGKIINLAVKLNLRQQWGPQVPMCIK